MGLRRGQRFQKFFPAWFLHFLLGFNRLSYAPKFHETESGSGAKNTAHHNNHLHVHARGLLSRLCYLCSCCRTVHPV